MRGGLLQDLGLCQLFLGDQVILLGRDFLLPEAFFPRKGGAGEIQAPERHEVLALQLGQLAALQHRQDLTPLDRIAKLLADLDDHPLDPRHHMGHPPRVELDLAGERQDRLEGCRACRFDLDPGLLGRSRGELDPAFDLPILPAVGLALVLSDRFDGKHVRLGDRLTASQVVPFHLKADGLRLLFRPLKL